MLIRASANYDFCRRSQQFHSNTTLTTTTIGMDEERLITRARKKTSILFLGNSGVYTAHDEQYAEAFKIDLPSMIS